MPYKDPTYGYMCPKGSISYTTDPRVLARKRLAGGDGTRVEIGDEIIEGTR